MTSRPRACVFSVAALVGALLASACAGSPAQTQEDLIYEPAQARDAYLAEAVPSVGTAAELRQGFRFCDELALLKTAGIEIGDLGEAAKARLWRRVALPFIRRGDVSLPGDESQLDSPRRVASAGVCPWLAAEFTGDPPIMDERRRVPYPAPRDARLAPDGATRPLAERVCQELSGSDVDGTATFLARLDAIAGKYRPADVYAWVSDVCPDAIDALRMQASGGSLGP